MGSGASNEFNASTKAECVVEKYRSVCEGKYVIVTGGNSGIGLETVKVLSAAGAKVVLCSRSVKNGNEAIADFKTQHPTADITVMQLDLGSFKSVNDFTTAYKAMKRPLHLLINNAGIMACPKALTEDGFESQFGVNHLGHFLLTKQLLPLLISSGTQQQPSRVVNLSSLANYLFPKPSGISLDDPTAEKHYQKWERYGESKLANILFTVELNNKMKSEGHPVISVSVHPGMIMSTNLLKDDSIGHMLNLLYTAGFSKVLAFVTASERSKTISEGASTTVVAALSPSIIAGEHYQDCQVSRYLHPIAHDAQYAKRLWVVSEELLASKGF